MFKASIGFIALAGLTSFACGSSLPPGGQGGAGGSSAGGQGGTTGQGGTSGACTFEPSQPGNRVALASIHVSASTNTGMIDVVIYSDGSAERTTGPGHVDAHDSLTPDPASFPAGTTEVLAFLCDLAAAGPVSQIPITDVCSKSASFGTTMKVTVGGESSGDLECLAATAPPAATTLAHDCDVLTARRS